MKNCKQCTSPFEITDFDHQFYTTMHVPEPTFCPDCRQQRRLTFRNERSLYKRKCDATGKSIISMYPSDASFPVYSQEYWWGDSWDPKDYGRDYDFDRPFFEQFSDLMQVVPRFNVSITNSENCEYNNFCVASRNCYMSQRLGDAEEAYYSYLVIESKNVMDSYYLTRCELCYEVIDGENCYDIHFSQNVISCSASRFLFNCNSCKYCFFCTDLRNKEYCFFNEQLTKEQYEEKIKEYEIISHTQRLDLTKRFLKLCSTQVVPHYWGNKTENVSGNYLVECKDTFDSYDCLHGEGVKHAYGHIYGENVMDVSFTFHIDQTYEFAAGSRCRDLRFCFNLYDSHNMTYCIDCVNNCHDSFGCIGLNHAEYCILNKQYTKEEYEELMPKIIEHMKKTDEWGEFFPTSISPFGYNEIAAFEYYPLTKKESLTKGWKWKESDDVISDVTKTIPASKLPDSIEDIPDDILNWGIICEVSDRPFKIVPQELKFYRTNKLPIPHLHPDERYKMRLSLRNPRKLCDRTCNKCSTDIKTSYHPDRPEKVYCEKCYLKEVY